MAKHHSRPLYYFSSPPGFFKFQFKTISRGCNGKPPSSPSYLQRNPRVDFKNAIVQVDDFPLLCLSPIFVIPKKTGPSSNLESEEKINVFISVQHFRMETLNVILPNLRPQDWAVSIDLKDAYLHVPVHPQSRRLLGFKFLDKTYVYKVLPFGLKESVGSFRE